MDLREVDIFAYVDNFKIHEHIKSIEIKKSEKDNYFLSIVIPTYKRPKELKEAIDSALNQEGDLFEYEVLVVDNNPERGDETEQLIATYTNSNLRYVKNSENLGMFGNWNRGFLLAKGGWLTMLHDDDMLFPYFLSVCKSHLQKTTDAFIPGRVAGENYKLVPQQKDIYIRRIHQHYLLNGCIPGAPIGLTVQKDQFTSTGGFNPDFYPASDYLWYVIFSSKYPFYQISTPLGFYRTTIGATNKPETLRGTIVTCYYLKRRLFKAISKIPYNCIIDYILGIDAIKLNTYICNKYFDCGFQLSDINLNCKMYSGTLSRLMSFVLWRMWRIFMRIIYLSFKYKKRFEY